jgi:hypothetical protein
VINRRSFAAAQVKSNWECRKRGRKRESERVGRAYELISSLAEIKRRQEEEEKEEAAGSVPKERKRERERESRVEAGLF